MWEYITKSGDDFTLCDFESKFACANTETTRKIANSMNMQIVWPKPESFFFCMSRIYTFTHTFIQVERKWNCKRMAMNKVQSRSK